MDPQNNNSFGSFGTGMPDGGSNGFGNEMSSDTNVSGQPIVSGPIVSGGATAVDNDNFVSSEFPKGGLSIGGGEKKSRKGLVAGLIVVFVLDYMHQWFQSYLEHVPYMYFVLDYMHQWFLYSLS